MKKENIEKLLSDLHSAEDNIQDAMKEVLNEKGEININLKPEEIREIKDRIIESAKRYRIALYKLFDCDYIDSITWKQELKKYNNTIFIGEKLERILSLIDEVNFS